MLRFRRKPAIKYFRTTSRVNEPLAQLVEPEPPWWENEGLAKVRDEVVNWLLEFEWAGVLELWEPLQNLFFRRPVREA